MTRDSIHSAPPTIHESCDGHTVAKMRRMPYLDRSFLAREPYNPIINGSLTERDLPLKAC